METNVKITHNSTYTVTYEHTKTAFIPTTTRTDEKASFEAVSHKYAVSVRHGGNLLKNSNI